MRLRVTIDSAGLRGPTRDEHPVDLLVDAPPGSTFAQVRRHLARAAGLGDADERLTFVTNGRAIAPGSLIGAPPLVDGVLIHAMSYAAGPAPAPPPAPAQGGLLELHVVAGPGAGRTVPLCAGTHVIGRSSGCTIRLDDPGVSRRHTELVVSADGVVVRDLEPTNPTLLRGKPVGDGARLDPDEPLHLGSTTLVLRRPDRTPAQTTAAGGVVSVHRPPRFRTRETTSAIAFPEAPRKPDGHRLPLISALAPVLLAGVLALVTRSPLMLLFALMSPVMLLGQWFGDRRHGRVSHRRALARHREEVDERRCEVVEALAREGVARRAGSPDLAAVGSGARTPESRLWERRPGDEDHLVVRTGVGTQPARLALAGAVPADLEDLQVEEVPVLVDLAGAGVLGISGPRARVLSQCASVLLQLATWHSPRDLRLVVLTSSPKPRSDWEWASRLPHAKPLRAESRIASVVSGDDENARHVIDELARIALQRNDPQGATQGMAAPALVVVLDGAHDLRKTPGVVALLKGGPRVGIHWICLDEVAERLPVETVVHVELDAGRAPRAVVRHQVETAPDVVPDLPSRAWVEQVARSLAPLRDATPEDDAGSVPERIGFRALHQQGGLALDPTDSASLAAHWSDPSRPRAALLGRSATGPYAVDLRTDGPHALVGGTTGAGKSELLQTLIAGLAVAHSPEELALVLVDYKGGSAFKDCARLPHTVGLVTDLDDHLGSRALTSLTAEVKRRERLLAQQGAKDLDDYVRTRHAESPVLPRLLIVVDEFKMLADELPDFVDGLVRIAAVGRSLGVHLVLATQRPGGIVSGDMRANIALRIALRVRDRSDSVDVVESPEAAGISDRHPGRALVRTAGLELHEVQTAYCGGALEQGDEDAPAAPVVWPLPWPSLAAEPPRHPGPADTVDGPTELAAFVTAARAAASALGIQPVPSPWLPALPEHLPATALPRAVDAPHRVPLGLVDRPRIQCQETWAWDLETDGHLALVGGARTGRTTALRTIALALAESLPPSAVHVHVLEGTPGPLRHLGALPQVGSIVGVDDARRARRVISRLLEEVARRRTRGALGAPRIVLLVDGWEQLEDAFEAIDHGAPTDDLLRLLRDGLSAGVSVAVTGGRALTGGRLSAVFGPRLVLAMPDPLDLTLAGVAPESVPARQGPGRAVDPRDACEVQLAFTGSSPAPADQDHAVAMTATVLGLEYAALPEQERPWGVAALPEHVALGDLPPSSGDGLTVGVGGDALDSLGFDPEQRRILVAGPPRSGRSTALATIARRLLEEGRTLAVVTTRRSPLTELRGIRGLHLLGAEDVDAFVALRREEPDVAIVVDDADALDGMPLEGVLLEAARLVDTAGGLVAIAVELHRASAAYRGLVPEVARHGAGLLLGARSPADGEVFRMRVDPDVGRLPGRGLLVTDGTATPVQIAMP